MVKPTAIEAQARTIGIERGYSNYAVRLHDSHFQASHYPRARCSDSCACTKNESRGYSSHYCKSFTKLHKPNDSGSHLALSKSDYQIITISTEGTAECGEASPSGDVCNPWSPALGTHRTCFPIAAFCCTAADHHMTGKRTASRGRPLFRKDVPSGKRLH